MSTKVFRTLRGHFSPRGIITATKLAQLETSLSALVESYGEERVERAIMSLSQDNPEMSIDNALKNLPEKICQNNLMKPGSFYYHEELRILPPMPVLKIREDGSEHLHFEPFYLEMRESYTLEDLLAYFQRKMKTTSIDKRKDIGAMRYLVNTYGLDEVLFTIDHVWEEYTWNDKKLPENPLELSNHIRQGMEDLEHMKGQARLYGTNKIIPRKQVSP